MLRMVAAAFLALAATLAGPVEAQTLDDIAKADAALDAAWVKAPLAMRQAFFVDGTPSGFGIYEKRPNSNFKQGEKLVTYAEPVGYGWKGNADNTYVFGFDIDLTLKSADGVEIQKKGNFFHLAATSHAKNREFFITLTLDLTGAPVGDYIVDYTVHDIASDKSAVISQPFSIVNAR